MKSLTGMAAGVAPQTLLDRFGLLGLEVARNAGLELLHQHRHAFGAALAVSDGKVHGNSLTRRAVLEEHLHGVADVAFVAA